MVSVFEEERENVLCFDDCGYNDIDWTIGADLETGEFCCLREDDQQRCFLGSKHFHQPVLTCLLIILTGKIYTLSQGTRLNIEFAIPCAS